MVLLFLGIQAGYLFAAFGALLGQGNGITHRSGYFKTRAYRITLGAGVFTAVPLGVSGGLVLVQNSAHIQR